MKTTNRRKWDGYLLTGLVYCGKCGQKMHGTCPSRRKVANGKDKCYRWPKYVCSTYTQQGFSGGCGHHTVTPAPLVQFLVTALRDQVLANYPDELRQRIRQQLAAHQGPNADELDRVETRIARFEKEIDRSAERLLRAGAAMTHRRIFPEMSE